jgi:hypothetical protein
MKRQILLYVLAGMFLAAFSPTFTSADPLPSRDILKFSQQPMNDTEVGVPGAVGRYWGHDELSTAYNLPGPAAGLYRGTFMADDFADKFTSPVVHVKWWGSYLDNFIDPATPVDRFLISFESDVPASATGGFSHPGQPLLNQIVRRAAAISGPGSGEFTEKLVSNGGPPLGEHLYEYNAELYLDKPFPQEPNKVYWLKIVALVDLPTAFPAPIDPINPPAGITRWGWHNRDYTKMNPLASTPPAVVPGEFLTVLGPSPGVPVWHFQDDAVTGIVNIDTSGRIGQIMPVITQDNYQPTRYLPEADGPGPIGQFSKDLAFELYTVPEPAASALVLVGLAGALAVRRKLLAVS